MEKIQFFGNKRANILATGGSGSGKTVAACNTFFKMAMDGGVTLGDDIRFDLIASGNSAGGDIHDFAEKYRDMIKGTLPVGSTDDHIYDFAFRRNGEKLCQIRWMDYRGSLRTTDYDDGDWEHFFEMLERATLLIYIISGELINDFISIKDGSLTGEKMALKKIDISEEVSHINTLMEKTKELRGSDDETPILFYVTQSDYIKYDDDNRKLEEIVSFLKTNELLRTGRKVLCCHSTLGRDIRLSDERNSIVAGFAPEGFEIPLMLTVGYALSEAGKEWEQEENAKIDAAIAEQELAVFNKTEKKGALANQFQTRLLKILKMERDDIRRLEFQIQKAKEEIGSLKVEQEKMRQNNVLRAYSQDVLNYVRAGSYACLVDEKGERIPLDEFFR